MDGIINIRKEAGYTSHDVVAKLRGILRERRIGHTGTLDPQATGVLPVCIGKATKLCELMLDKEKTYEAVLLPGVITDTEDMTGNILERREVQITAEDIMRAAKHFTGKYGQIPPMYSALKVDGKRLYELAREGREIERKPREVELFENTPLSFSLREDGYVESAVLRVRCSKGTYIRSLLRDMGEYLGCGACMKSLVRTKAGVFALTDAVTLSQVEQARDTGHLEEILLPIDTFLANYPQGTILPEAERLLYNGNQLTLTMLRDKVSLADGDRIRLYDTKGRLIGLYFYRKDKNLLQSEKMF
ncbi:MAG: tRNA pseudouridine(55) synthase TruB [Lachnospiraceae bacterium]|nr:tRNA pseudouridine(55) synthase TruB [Lachnospiraceae bacterium]